MVAADVYRPAAINQLVTIGKQLDIEVFEMGILTKPQVIAKKGLEYAKEKGYNVVLIDTAGRLAIDEALMQELVEIKDIVNPDEILLTVDAMTGQDAVNVATKFHEKLDVTGCLLTKLDSDTRGGAALSIRSVVNKPIKFVGTGEKLDAIDQFHPARMADRILGMGDIVSLVERAQEQYDEEEAKRLQKKIAKNQFDFNDFLSQIAQIKKMGNLKDRESRRRASVVGSIIEQQPSGETMQRSTSRGRPKEDRELRKRVSLSVLPSLYEDIQKIAYVERRSVSELLSDLMLQYREQQKSALSEYEKVRK